MLKRGIFRLGPSIVDASHRQVLIKLVRMKQLGRTRRDNHTLFDLLAPYITKAL